MNLSSFWTSTVLRGLEMGLEWQSAYGKHIYNPALNYTWPWRMDCTAQSPQSKHPRAKAIPPSQSPFIMFSVQNPGMFSEHVPVHKRSYYEPVKCSRYRFVQICNRHIPVTSGKVNFPKQFVSNMLRHTQVIMAKACYDFFFFNSSQPRGCSKLAICFQYAATHTGDNGQSTL